MYNPIKSGKMEKYRPKWRCTRENIADIIDVSSERDGRKPRPRLAYLDNLHTD